MLVAWLWLADAIGARLPLSPRVVAGAVRAGAAAGVPDAAGLPCVRRDLGRASPLAYLDDAGRRRHCRSCRSALALVLALVELRGVGARGRPLRAALVMSVLLFAAGGFIGFAISGANVKIPAHYHGCIVGITLALMGVAYELLPRLGFRAPSGRLATWQPCVYGAGQLLHIAGLVWSGGYGVQRKVAGADQVLSGLEQVAAMGSDGPGRVDRGGRRYPVPGRGGAVHAGAARVRGGGMSSVSRYMRADRRYCDGLFDLIEPLALAGKWGAAGQASIAFCCALQRHFEREERVLFPLWRGARRCCSAPPGRCARARRHAGVADRGRRRPGARSDAKKLAAVMETLRARCSSTT